MTVHGKDPMDKGKASGKGWMKNGKGWQTMTQQDIFNEAMHGDMQDLRNQVNVLQAACMCLLALV